MVFQPLIQNSFVRMTGGVSSAAAVPTYQDKVLALSPIAYWPLTEAAGTAATELVGGLNGTYKRDVTTMGTGAGPIAGQTAPNFDGTNDCVNAFSAALAALVNGQEGSLAAWIKVSGAGDWADAAWRTAVLTYKTNTNNAVGMDKSSTANRFTFTYNANATGEARNEIIGPSTAWFHVAITFTLAGDAVIYYLNGAALETDTGLGTFVNPITLFMIGANSAVPGQPWKGSISNVAIWSSPLTAPQVLSLATP